MRKKYLIQPGDKYGDYTIIEKTKRINPTGYVDHGWIWEDSEGNQSFIRQSGIVSRFEVKEPPEYTFYAQLIAEGKHQMGTRKEIYREYKANAQKRKRDFLLTFEELNSLITGNCFYCGSEPVEVKRWMRRMHKGQPPIKLNGIDRIDSNKEYSVENCVPCCAMCNYMKNVFSTDEFLQQIAKIYNFKIGSTTIPKGSTLETNASGNGDSPAKEKDIV